ncbi:conjugative transfer region protein TrbK [Sphingomonas guangdongensis]|uniref:Conjugative transfer region protein TrbK n=1 Tax=Sphingomonas guangdongensis TaxID=1141890 RepID=A0A285QYU3_9SPHN|nr:putative entry exclusion protein TrbK-alt [Sphingomonas guangdongensis]SOB87135.1 conjugative transfer region protein TrbK [Sphingomonas guangdongensis]
MDGKLFARIGAVVFVALAITATAVEMTRDKTPAARPDLLQPVAQAEDPLRAELVRCQQLGEGGPRDVTCLRAWAENRRRFLAPGARPSGRLPSAASPQAPSPNAEAANP